MNFSFLQILMKDFVLKQREYVKLLVYLKKISYKFFKNIRMKKLFFHIKLFLNECSHVVPSRLLIKFINIYHKIKYKNIY